MGEFFMKGFFIGILLVLFMFSIGIVCNLCQKNEWENKTVIYYLDGSDMMMIVDSEDLFGSATEDDQKKMAVYITPTGKRYHYRPTCAGKNATEIDFNQAQERYTPCQKCAQQPPL